MDEGFVTSTFFYQQNRRAVRAGSSAGRGEPMAAPLAGRSRLRVSRVEDALAISQTLGNVVLSPSPGSWCSFLSLSHSSPGIGIISFIILGVRTGSVGRHPPVDAPSLHVNNTAAALSPGAHHGYSRYDACNGY